MLERTGAVAEAANASNDLGLFYWRRGDFAAALSHYERALRQWERLGSHSKVARVLNNIGVVYYEWARYEQAIEYYRRSLELAAEHGCRTVAFPAISQGIFGYPPDQATEVAVGTVREALAAYMPHLRDPLTIELTTTSDQPLGAALSITLLALVLLSALAAAPLRAQETGDWVPRLLSDEVQADHYVPDFSYVGYHWGEKPIPTRFPGHTVVDVTAYGAVPDDGEDDTAALQAALRAAHETDGPVLMRLPAGRFILKDILFIERSDFVLQGAGSGEDGTTLYMPEPLESLPTPPYMQELEEYLLANDKRQRERERGVDEPFSLYSWSGGFIWVTYPGARGKPYLGAYDRPQTVLATVREGRRGEHTLLVEDASRLEEGQLVRINWYNTEGEESSLIEYLYDGYDNQLKVGERHWENPDQALTKQEVTINAIDGTTVHIKEPLLHDLRPEAQIRHEVAIHDVEVDHVRARLGVLYQEYRYHHVEYGFNAIYLTNAAHSWVRDVTFRNGDNGLLTDVCSNSTIEDVEVYGRRYHYGVHYGDCYNMLARDVYVQAPVVHTFTFNTGSRMCVYTNCTGTHATTLDQHRFMIDKRRHNPLCGCTLPRPLFAPAVNHRFRIAHEKLCRIRRDVLRLKREIRQIRQRPAVECVTGHGFIPGQRPGGWPPLEILPQPQRRAQRPIRL